MPTVDVRLVDVVKKFGEAVAVDDINLDVLDGEFFSLLGRRPHLDIPDLHLGLGTGRRAGPGQRHRRRLLPDRCQVRGADHVLPVAREPAHAPASPDLERTEAHSGRAILTEAEA